MLNRSDDGLNKRAKQDVSNVDSLDIARFVSLKNIDDDAKLNLINNHWQPSADFVFPISTPSNRKFCYNLFQRWSWLCYSKLFDGAFCLSCVLLGRHTGHNGSKLFKLHKEPLTNWQSAVTKLEYHQKHSDLHHDFMLSMLEFKNVMTSNTKGIDEQVDRIRSARIQYNRYILKRLVDTVILASRQNDPLRGHRDDSQH